MEKSLINKIDSLIAEAMKGKEKIRLETLKLIKTALVKAQKDGVVLSEATEGKLLQKMVKQSEDAIDQFRKGDRNDLAEEEEKQLNIIKEFAPAEISETELTDFVKGVCKKMEDEGKEISMKLMREIMAETQKVYPTANGKIISDVVKNWKK